MAEVADAFVTLMPSFKGGQAAITKELGGSLDGAGREGGKRFGGGMAAGVGAMAAKVFAPLAAAAATVSLGGFLKGAITSAGDLQQSVGAIDTVFKGSAGQMHQWAAAAAQSVGLTKNEYNQLGTLIGTQLRNGGTAMDELGPKTDNLIKLGADLSSMFGGTTSDAVAALSSALKGERDPIEAYGVSLTQAAIDAKAAELGFKKVGGSLSQEASQAATLALIMDQTADAHGNFARETDTLAHQQQVLGAQWSNMKATLGTALLPVVTKFVTFLNTSMLPAFSAVGGAIGKVRAAFGFLFEDTDSQGFAEVMDNMLGNTGKLVPVFRVVGDAVRSFVFGIRAVGAAFRDGDVTSDGFVGKMEVLGNWIRTDLIPAFQRVVGAVQGMAAAILPIAQQIVAFFIAHWPQISAVIGRVFDVAREVIVNALTVIAQIIKGVTAAIVFIWQNWGADILAFVSAVFTNIGQVIGGALDVIQGIFRLFKAVFTGDWKGAWDAVKQILSGAWELIKGVVNLGLTVIKGALSGAWALIKTGASAAWEGIKSVISAAWDRIKTAVVTKAAELVTEARAIPGKIVTALGDLGSKLFQAGQDLLQGLINGIKAKVTGAVTAVKNAVGSVIDGAMGLLEINSPSKVFMRIGESTGEGMILGIQRSQSAVAAASRSLVSVPSVPRASFGDAALGGAYGNGRQVIINAYGAREEVLAANVVHRMDERDRLEPAWGAA